MTAASALLFGGATVGHSVGVDAATRAALSEQIDATATSIVRTQETGRAVVAAQLTAAVCVIEASDRLAPAGSVGARYPMASVDRAAAIVQLASDAATVPAYDPAPPLRPARAAAVEELEAALATLGTAEVETEAEVARLASAARRAEQDCAAANATVAAFVDEVVRRTDVLVAANPKASAEAVAALRSARDAVVAADAEAVEAWIAAAAAVEASHSAAIRAEQEAEAARRSAASEDATTTSPPVTAFDPNQPPWEPVALSPEELCRLVPSLCTNGVPTPLPLGPN